MCKSTVPNTSEIEVLIDLQTLASILSYFDRDHLNFLVIGDSSL